MTVNGIGGESTIRVHRRAYRRKDGVRVKATNYLTPDRGKRGRTPESEKLPFALRPGKLRGWKKGSPPGSRHRVLEKIVRNEGYATATRRLTALKNLSADKATDRAVDADLRYLRKKHRS